MYEVVCFFLKGNVMPVPDHKIFCSMFGQTPQRKINSQDNFNAQSSNIPPNRTYNSYFGTTAIVAGWGVTQTRMIRGSPVKVRALPDRAKHVKVEVKRCEVGGVRAEFDYPEGVLCASDKSEWM